jgi:hypothetical protein
MAVIAAETAAVEAGTMMGLDRDRAVVAPVARSTEVVMTLAVASPAMDHGIVT